MSIYTPQASHAVRITGSLNAPGSVGIIGGVVGLGNDPDDEIRVMFDFQFPFRVFRGSVIGSDLTICSASGEQACYLKAGSLTPTNETVTVTFYRWKDDWPGTDEEYALDVPLWEYRP